MKKIYTLFFYTLVITFSVAQESYRDSLNIEIKKAEEPILFLKKKINSTRTQIRLAVAFNQLGLQYQYQNQFDSALSCHHLALKHAINVGESNQEIGVSYNKIGIVHYYLGQADSAYYFIKKGVPLFEEPNAKANALNNLALMCKFRKEPDEAISNYLQALKIYQLFKDTVKQITLFNNIGALYFNQNEDSLAEIYNEKALLMAQLYEDEELVIDSKVSLASIFFNRGQYEKAIAIHEEAILYYKSAGKVNLVIVNQNNLANSFSEIGNLNKALAIYMETLHLMETNEVLISKEAVLLNIGSIYQEKQQFNKALEYYKLSLKFATENQITYRYVPIYEGLSSVYKDLNNIDSSLHYKNLHIALKDSLDAVEKEKKMMELESKHQNRELNTNLSKAQEVLDETVESKNLFSRILLVTVSALIIVGFAVFYFYNRNKKNKALSDTLRDANRKKDDNILNLSSTLKEKDHALVNLAMQKVGVKLDFPPNLEPLTEREKEVLLGVKDGLKDQEIAESLFISITTVRTHLRKAYVKIDARNRAEAIQFINTYHI